jgi:GNAT superfamily N-acetyltransferase
VSRRDLVTVRMAGERDVGAIALLRALWTTGQPDAELDAAMGAWLASEGERRTVWLATVGGAPVGMASLFEYRRMPNPVRPDSRWGYLSNMYVREEFRSRGIGSALLGAAIDVAAQRGYARLVLSPSREAVPFYRRAGFVDPDEGAGEDRLLVRRLSA